MDSSPARSHPGSLGGPRQEPSTPPDTGGSTGGDALPAEWIPIDDPGDPRIAHFVGLRDRELAPRVAHRASRADRHHGGSGVFIAEGDIVAERAVRAGYSLRAVLVDVTRTGPLPADFPADTPVYAATPAALKHITGLGVDRGLLGCFDRRPARAVDEVLAGARRVVVLERVSNPTNLGVILRSAAGLGMDAVLLDPTCSDPLYRRTARAAMGEGYAFPWAWIPRLPGGLEPLRGRGFRLVALTPERDAVPIDEVPIDAVPAGAHAVERALAGDQPGRGRASDDVQGDEQGDEQGDVNGDEKVALLLGAEGPGLSRDTLDAADVRVSIPMSGGVDSLNVGVAAGIAFWVLGRGGRGARWADRRSARLVII